LNIKGAAAVDRDVAGGAGDGTTDEGHIGQHIIKGVYIKGAPIHGQVAGGQQGTVGTEGQGAAIDESAARINADSKQGEIAVARFGYRTGAVDPRIEAAGGSLIKHQRGIVHDVSAQIGGVAGEDQRARVDDGQAGIGVIARESETGAARLRQSPGAGNGRSKAAVGGLVENHGGVVHQVSTQQGSVGGEDQVADIDGGDSAVVPHSVQGQVSGTDFGQATEAAVAEGAIKNEIIDAGVQRGDAGDEINRPARGDVGGDAGGELERATAGRKVFKTKISGIGVEDQGAGIDEDIPGAQRIHGAQR